MTNNTGPVVLGGRFVLPASEIGSGGHARLFKAYDNEIGGFVAVKLFSPAVHVDPKILTLSWSNELDVYRRLGPHPNLLQVVDFGTPADGAPWIAFEWAGVDLESVSNDAPLSWPQLQPIAIEVLRGLRVLHAKGWVHRDLKPANILIEADRIRVADFGTMRYREVTSFGGMTMSQLGTRPFSPPESGTENPLPAYDVYSFAVLLICCLLNDFKLDGTVAEAALARVEVPDSIRLLLSRCLEQDVDQRPGSAGVVLAELEQIVKGASETNEIAEVALDLPANVKQIFQELTLAETAGFDEFKLEFGPRARIVRDPKAVGGLGLLLVGRSLIASVAPHGRQAGALYVRHVWRPPVAHLERLRKRCISVSLRWVAVSMRPLEADATISEIQRLISQRDAIQAEEHVRDEVHDRWERVLDAKFFLARQSGKDIPYSAVRAEGARVYLTMTDGAVDPPLGELRVIRTTTGRHLRGEVEAIEGNEVVLYVNEGSPEDLPRKGTLTVDAERTVSKLRREQDAVRRVFEGGAVRPDLKNILTNPAHNPLPEEVTIEAFDQDQLDDAKREAVSSVLGAQGISLVKGPPGTGKTTLIAELVAQQLRRKPDSRILLASQTHIALDHALSKVTRVSPDASILRIGSPDQLSALSEAWTVPSQLKAWRAETEASVAVFVREQLISAGAFSVQTRGAATRLRALVERQVRTDGQLVTTEADLKAATAEQASVRSQVDSLLNSVGALESSVVGAASDLVDEISHFVDAIIRVGADIEKRAPALQRVQELRELVTELHDRRNEIQSDVDQVFGDLRGEDALVDVADVDEMLQRIDESKSAEDDRVAAFQLLAEDWLERFRPTGEFRVALLFRASIVASTCVALTGSRGADRVTFDLCIVDEASKATPTELMVPMANARQWVLVGDDKQLPPFLDPKLVDTDFLAERELTRMEVDERLFTELGESLPGECISTLTHQHRMHQDIGKLVSDVFYEGHLKSTDRPLSPLVERALTTAVSWRDTGQKETEQRVGLSFANRIEAREVAKLVAHIDNYATLLGLESVEIAVLSGYAAQVRTLQEVLGSAKSKMKAVRVRVATIDSFQGQEADICVVSLTRSNQRGDVGFLSAPERLNVAISRARDGLVIVGNRSMAQNPNAKRKSKWLAAVARLAPLGAVARNGR